MPLPVSCSVWRSPNLESLVGQRLGTQIAEEVEDAACIFASWLRVNERSVE
jgi:hypothetical protein